MRKSCCRSFIERPPNATKLAQPVEARSTGLRNVFLGGQIQRSGRSEYSHMIAGGHSCLRRAAGQKHNYRQALTVLRRGSAVLCWNISVLFLVVLTTKLNSLPTMAHLHRLGLDRGDWMIDWFIDWLIPAYGGARSRWLTAHPAIEIPDRPTARTIMATAPYWLHSMNPVPTRHRAGPRNPARTEIQIDKYNQH